MKAHVRDPGPPPTTTAAAFLLWGARLQWRTLVAGVICGIVWMTALSLVPAAIGRGVDEGLVGGDRSALVRWAGIPPCLAGHRRGGSGAPLVRRPELARRCLPHHRRHRRGGHLTRPGDRPRVPDRRCRQRDDDGHGARRPCLRHLCPLLRRDRQLCRRRRHPAARVGPRPALVVLVGAPVLLGLLSSSSGPPTSPGGQRESPAGSPRSAPTPSRDCGSLRAGSAANASSSDGMPRRASAFAPRVYGWPGYRRRSTPRRFSCRGCSSSRCGRERGRWSRVG